MRDAAAEARAVEKAGMELTYCRVLLEHLKCLYRTAKKCPRVDHATYVRQALEISKQHTTKFAQTLAKAAPDLFTFILYDLEPTNNHSERTMRFVVGHRNVRMQVCSMWRCNTLWTCISVWRLYWNCTPRRIQIAAVILDIRMEDHPSTHVARIPKTVRFADTL